MALIIHKTAAAAIPVLQDGVMMPITLEAATGRR